MKCGFILVLSIVFATMAQKLPLKSMTKLEQKDYRAQIDLLAKAIKRTQELQQHAQQLFIEFLNKKRCHTFTPLFAPYLTKEDKNNHCYQVAVWHAPCAQISAAASQFDVHVCAEMAELARLHEEIQQHWFSTVKIFHEDCSCDIPI